MVYCAKRRDDMFEITLIAMGKLKEKFYLSAAAEYEKRMKAYCSFKLIELPEHRLPEDPSPAEIQTGLDKEAELIFQKIPKGSWFCIFTPRLHLSRLQYFLFPKSFLSVHLSFTTSLQFLRAT